MYDHKSALGIAFNESLVLLYIDLGLVGFNCLFVKAMMSLLRQRKDEVDWALLETVLPGCMDFTHFWLLSLKMFVVVLVDPSSM